MRCGRCWCGGCGHRCGEVIGVSSFFFLFLFSLYIGVNRLQALKELLGLSVQGMMLEVADRPSGGSIYVGGAVLVGIEGAVDENGEPEIPIWSSSTANEIIKKTLI